MFHQNQIPCIQIWLRSDEEDEVVLQQKINSINTALKLQTFLILFESLYLLKSIFIYINIFLMPVDAL